MLSQLHFGPEPFWQSVANLIRIDPRVAIRPVEAPYFAGLYFLFGLQPIGYHVVNMVIEVLAAWFLYLGCARLTNNSLAATLAAMMLILCPVHDSTHYWIVASSISLSAMLFLLSLWLSVKAVSDARPKLHILSGIAFATSLFNYEAFIALIVLLYGAVFIATDRQLSLIARGQAALNAVALHLIAIACLWYYQRNLAPHLCASESFHRITFDPGRIAHVIFEGLRVTCSPQALGFYGEQAFSFVTASFNPLPVLLVFPISLAMILISPSPSEARGSYSLIMLGLIAIFASYVIFGLNPSYVPTNNTIMNRINTGAAIGISMLFAGIISSVLKLMLPAFTCRRAALGAVACATSCLMLFFALANNGMSRPWITSAKLQEEIQQIVVQEADTLFASSSVFLSRVPRYVLWSPMFDGVWDFQSMVRITLDDPDKIAGVMSDRIIFENDRVRDVSHGALCGEYPFKNMCVITLDPKRLAKVNSCDEFVRAVTGEPCAASMSP